MARHDLIKIIYPGSCISVNHYLGKRKDGGYYIKPETQAWKREFQWLLKKCHLEEYKLPLEVTCSGYFKDKRSSVDLSNLSKVILDSIQELSGINDKFMKWHDGERLVGYKEPYLLILIKEAGDTTGMPANAVQPFSSGIGKKSNRIDHAKNAIKKSK